MGKSQEAKRMRIEGPLRYGYRKRSSKGKPREWERGNIEEDNG